MDVEVLDIVKREVQISCERHEQGIKVALCNSQLLRPGLYCEYQGGANPLH
jgi:hypothetical protein